jgi:hypothetical protein
MDMLCYCYHCDKRVDVEIKNMLIEGNIKGVRYQYLGDIAYCTICNNEVYISKINDTNTETAHQAYKLALKNVELKG